MFIANSTQERLIQFYTDKKTLLQFETKGYLFTRFWLRSKHFMIPLHLEDQWVMVAEALIGQKVGRNKITGFYNKALMWENAKSEGLQV